MSYADDGKMQEFLRRPFPPKLIGRLPKTPKRPALDYVGHAAVTDRLNAAAPGWSYTVQSEFSHGGAFWVRIAITVGDVTRIEYGDGADPKEALGNAIRRGAMRYGVALDLWSKEELQASSNPAQVTRSSGRDGEDRGAEGAGDGEASAPEAPHTPSAQPAGHHEHHWQPSPTMNGWRWCDVKGCGKAEKKPVTVRPIEEVPAI